MVSEILRKTVERKLNRTMDSKSCAFEFGPKSFRCHSVVVNTKKSDLLKMVEALCHELVAAVNVLEHPPQMIDSYVKSCEFSFNAGWSKNSDIELFFIRNDSLQIGFSKIKKGYQRSLAIFVQDKNMNSIFLDLNDTIATDRIWFLTQKFTRKNAN